MHEIERAKMNHPVINMEANYSIRISSAADNFRDD